MWRGRSKLRASKCEYSVNDGGYGQSPTNGSMGSAGVLAGDVYNNEKAVHSGHVTRNAIVIRQSFMYTY